MSEICFGWDPSWILTTQNLHLLLFHKFDIQTIKASSTIHHEFVLYAYFQLGFANHDSKYHYTAIFQVLLSTLRNLQIC